LNLSADLTKVFVDDLDLLQASNRVEIGGLCLYASLFLVIRLSRLPVFLAGGSSFGSVSSSMSIICPVMVFSIPGAGFGIVHGKAETGEEEEEREPLKPNMSLYIGEAYATSLIGAALLHWFELLNRRCWACAKKRDF